MKKKTIPAPGCEVDPNSVVIANFVKNYPKKIFGKIIKHTPVCMSGPDHASKTQNAKSVEQLLSHCRTRTAIAYATRGQKLYVDKDFKKLGSILIFYAVIDLINHNT